MELRVGVKALIQNKQGQHLFLRRNPEKYPSIAHFWDIPGGRIYPDESCETALKREVREELGMQVDEISRWPVAAQDIFVDNGPHIVRLTYRLKASGQPELSDEHVEFKWMDTRQAAEYEIDPYIVEVLQV